MRAGEATPSAVMITSCYKCYQHSLIAANVAWQERQRQQPRASDAVTGMDSYFWLI